MKTTAKLFKKVIESAFSDSRYKIKKVAFLVAGDILTIAISHSAKRVSPEFEKSLKVLLSKEATANSGSVKFSAKKGSNDDKLLTVVCRVVDECTGTGSSTRKPKTTKTDKKSTSKTTKTDKKSDKKSNKKEKETKKPKVAKSSFEMPEKFNRRPVEGDFAENFVYVVTAYPDSDKMPLKEKDFMKKFKMGDISVQLIGLKSRNNIIKNVALEVMRGEDKGDVLLVSMKDVAEWL